MEELAALLERALVVAEPVAALVRVQPQPRLHDVDQLPVRRQSGGTGARGEAGGARGEGARDDGEPRVRRAPNAQLHLRSSMAFRGSGGAGRADLLAPA